MANGLFIQCSILESPLLNLRESPLSGSALQGNQITASRYKRGIFVQRTVNGFHSLGAHDYYQDVFTGYDVPSWIPHPGNQNSTPVNYIGAPIAGTSYAPRPANIYDNAVENVRLFRTLKDEFNAWDNYVRNSTDIVYDDFGGEVGVSNNNYTGSNLATESYYTCLTEIGTNNYPMTTSRRPTVFDTASGYDYRWNPVGTLINMYGLGYAVWGHSQLMNYVGSAPNAFGTFGGFQEWLDMTGLYWQQPYDYYHRTLDSWGTKQLFNEVNLPDQYHRVKADFDSKTFPTQFTASNQGGLSCLYHNIIINDFADYRGTYTASIHDDSLYSGSGGFNGPPLSGLDAWTGWDIAGGNNIYCIKSEVKLAVGNLSVKYFMIEVMSALPMPGEMYYADTGASASYAGPQWSYTLNLVSSSGDLLAGQIAGLGKDVDIPYPDREPYPLNNVNGRAQQNHYFGVVLDLTPSEWAKKYNYKFGTNNIVMGP